MSLLSQRLYLYFLLFDDNIKLVLLILFGLSELELLLFELSLVCQNLSSFVSQSLILL